MKALTPSEHKALASLAPTREVYGKPPLPIEILAAGGPRALKAWLKERTKWRYSPRKPGAGFEPATTGGTNPRALSTELPRLVAPGDGGRVLLTETAPDSSSPGGEYGVRTTSEVFDSPAPPEVSP